MQIAVIGREITGVKMTDYNLQALIKVIDLNKKIPTRGKKLYPGYEALIKCDGRQYQEFRKIVGPRPQPDTRIFSPSSVIKHAIEKNYIKPIEKIDTFDAKREKEERKAENSIENDLSIEETDRNQLIKARRGQGRFRDEVIKIEKACRLTGVSAHEHLRASHIKPWCESDNEGRLDGNNGLLLAPHVDHLFDRGYITFDENGTLQVSPQLHKNVLKSWGLSIEKIEAQPFNTEQQTYMAYHRMKVFRDKAP